MDWLGITLPDLLMFAAIGFAAQLVDGALGMAFGVITNTLLVGLMGLPPAQASQRVHVVECFTTAISGISHLLHRNIDGKLFLRLLIPGVLGGVTGAYLISNIDSEVVRPLVMIYLAAIGVFLLLRGIFYPPKLREARLVAPLGLIGGFLDAAGGGGWGPVVTSNLLIQGTEPRKVIGTVNAVEFFLTLSISATFITQIGLADLVGPTLGLLIGGMAAAPFGAWFARRLPVKAMLILVGTVLSATSAYAVWTAWS